MSKGKTYPVIDSPVHGKQDGETFSSASQSVGKLQPFLEAPVIIFPILAVQIDFSVVATL